MSGSVRTTALIALSSASVFSTCAVNEAWLLLTTCVLLQGVLQDVELNQRMTEVCRNSVRAFVEDRTDSDGRVSIKALNKFAQMTGFGAQEPWNGVIKVCCATPWTLCCDYI